MFCNYPFGYKRVVGYSPFKGNSYKKLLMDKILKLECLFFAK